MFARSAVCFIVCLSVIAGCGEDKTGQLGSELTGETAQFQLVAPDRFLAGACAQFKVVASEPVKEEVLFAEGDITLPMYRDSSCHFPIGSVAMAAGSDTAIYYVETTHAGAFAQSLSWDAGKSIQAAGTVLPSSSLKLSVEGRATALAGQCLPVTIKVKDEFGNDANLSSTLALSAGFFRNSTCADAQKVVALPFEGRSSYPLYTMRTAAGTFSFRATAVGVADGNLSVVTSPAGLRNIWVNLPRPALNVCSPVVVRVGDRFGNDMPSTSDLQIRITPAGGAQFFTDSACATTAKTAPFNVAIAKTQARAAMLYVKGTMAGSAVIAGAVATSSPTLALTAYSGNLVTDIGLNARSLVFTLPTAPPANLLRTACTKMTVQLRNSANAPLAALADYSPLLKGTSVSAKFYSDAGCTTAITKVKIAKNTNNASFWFKDVSTVTGNHFEDVQVADPQNLYVPATMRITSRKP